jgi:hypothetical protein
MTKDAYATNGARFAELLRWHQRHVGLYARVATKAEVTPAYVSLVARGFRRNEKLTAALSKELEHLLETAPK